MADDEASNGRVTNALIKKDLEHLNTQVHLLNELLRSTIEQGEHRLLHIETQQARDDERIKGMCKEVNDLSKRSNLIDAASAMGTAFAIFLGFNRP